MWSTRSKYVGTYGNVQAIFQIGMNNTENAQRVVLKSPYIWQMALKTEQKFTCLQRRSPI